MRELYNDAVGDARRTTYEDNDQPTLLLSISVMTRTRYPPSAPVSSPRFLLDSPDSSEKQEEDDSFSSDSATKDRRHSDRLGLEGC